jgi:flagellin-like hook-associated protein FlgL
MVDTDYANAFSEMQRIQVAFDSAMAVHSNMFGSSLLDYL